MTLILEIAGGIIVGYLILQFWRQLAALSIYLVFLALIISAGILFFYTEVGKQILGFLIVVLLPVAWLIKKYPSGLPYFQVKNDKK